MNNPASEQPSTRRVLWAFSVLCVGLVVALWIAPMRVRPQPPIPRDVWRLEQMFVNEAEVSYSLAGEFYIQFIDELNVVRGHDGCNFFLFRVNQETTSGALRFYGAGQVTLKGCYVLENEGTTRVEIEGFAMVLPYIDKYEFSNEQLILSSFSGNQRFIFSSLGQSAEARVNNLPLPRNP